MLRSKLKSKSRIANTLIEISMLYKKDSSQFGKAFGLACNCIFKLSIMSKYCDRDNNQNHGVQCSVPSFPILLRSVASERTVQMSAFTTLIEWATLVRASSDTTAGDGKKTTLVNMELVMSQSQLQLMMKNNKINQAWPSPRSSYYFGGITLI